MAQAPATLFLLLILISVAVECHQAHKVYSTKAIHTPPMSTGCLDQLDALLRSVKQTGASQRELRRIARFYLQELVEYEEHGREDGGIIPPDLPPQLAPHLNSDCAGELKQHTPRGVLAGVLRQLPAD